MRGTISLLALLMAAILFGGQATVAATRAIDASTAWAYPPSALPPPPDPRKGGERVQLSGSALSLTKAQLGNLFGVPDWQPQGHPAMPDVVAHGRKPVVMACGYCHLPTGDGRPENATLAGLSRAYIVEQMQDFAGGNRRSSDASRMPTLTMAGIAKAATPAEIQAAADYFAALPHHQFTRIIEARRVPRTRTDGWIYSRDPAGGYEPLGARIIEMPEDVTRFDRRDPATRYIAYAPIGSVRRGAALVKSWGQGTYACATCHGADLRGAGDVPPIAGRSPTFLVRQLNDFHTGARGGASSALMKSVTAAMRNDDMVAVAAYLASR